MRHDTPARFLLVFVLLLAGEPVRGQPQRSTPVEQAQTAPLTIVCSRYDSPAEILVADDWRSAKINPSDQFGSMTCREVAGAFRSCTGPQLPDAGLAATFTRTGDSISVRLTGNSIAGPRELARLDCWHIGRGDPPGHPKTFMLDYRVTGGRAGFDRHSRLTHPGDLYISANTQARGSHLRTQPSRDLLNAITEYLKAAQPVRSGSTSQDPEAEVRSLALITGGSRYDLEPRADVSRLLDEAMQRALTSAIVGTWRESGWALCRPAAQLRPEQVDPPIDRLIFGHDGQFSVTWRGGGARVYGDSNKAAPHTALPDYSGRYTIQPDSGRVRLTFERGIYQPRDFAGDGFFRINGDTLDLTRVWLGTYEARQKPDICELTFVRVGG